MNEVHKRSCTADYCNKKLDNLKRYAVKYQILLSLFHPPLSFLSQNNCSASFQIDVRLSGVLAARGGGQLRTHLPSLSKGTKYVLLQKI